MNVHSVGKYVGRIWEYISWVSIKVYKNLSSFNSSKKKAKIFMCKDKILSRENKV